jgi:HEAT repeat protein
MTRFQRMQPGPHQSPKEDLMTFLPANMDIQNPRPLSESVSVNQDGLLLQEELAEMNEALGMLDSRDNVQRFRGESRLARLGERIASHLLDELATSAWGPRQFGVLEALKVIRPADAVAELIKYLDWPDADVRLAVLRTLRWLPVGNDPFLRALGDQEWRIRREAVFCLSGLGGQQVLLPLARALSDDHFQVRAAAANVLGMLGLKDAQPLLRKALRDESQRVKAMAAWSLARWHDPASLRPLLEALPTAQGEAKERILQALRGFSSPLALTAALNACADPDPAVQAKAAAILGQGGDQATTARLQCFFRTSNIEMVHKAAWAIAALEIVSREGLKALLQDADETMRYFAVCALGYVNLQDAHDRLFTLAEQERTMVNRTAVQGLKCIRNKSRPHLVQ